MRTWGAALDQLCRGDQAMSERDLFDHVGIVAGAAEPLVDHIDEPDVLTAVQLGVNQVRSVDVEDHVVSWPGRRPGRRKSRGMGVVDAVSHTAIMTRGCNEVSEPVPQKGLVGVRQLR